MTEAMISKEYMTASPNWPENHLVFMSAMAPARGVTYRYGRASRTHRPDPRYLHEVRQNAECVAYSCGIYGIVGEADAVAGDLLVGVEERASA